MGIDDISMLTMSMGDIPRYTAQSATQTATVEFDSMFIQALLQAGNGDETNPESDEMNVWNGMLAYSLAQELASQGGFGLTQTQINELNTSGGQRR